MRPKNPWITVAPVYDASGLLNAGQHGQVKAGQILYLVHITAEWASNGLWVADLRLELPIEKTFLMNQYPIEAFSDETQYATLAQRLGARRQRLAAPQVMPGFGGRSVVRRSAVAARRRRRVERIGV
jgi:hypothetical protein